MLTCTASVYTDVHHPLTRQKEVIRKGCRRTFSTFPLQKFAFHKKNVDKLKFLFNVSAVKSRLLALFKNETKYKICKFYTLRTAKGTWIKKKFSNL